MMKQSGLFNNFSVYTFIIISLTAIISISITYFGFYFEILDYSLADYFMRLGIAVFISLLFAIILALITSYKTYRYTQSLSNAILSVSNGNFDCKVDPKKNKIFKDVIISFNEMIDELSRTEILREDFLSGFSHECRTPINNIFGYAKLLQDPNTTEDEKVEYIDMIVGQANRLHNLSESILQLSNITTKSNYIEQTEYRIDEQLRQILISFDAQIPENINLNYEIDKINVKFREMHSYYLFSNLISNAIKFTKSKIFISLSRDNDIVKFIISDDGIGMDEVTIKHIYDVSFQAEKSHAKGCGLGMSIVKKIIDCDNIKLTIKSELGRGTTFVAEIPVQ